MVLEDALTLRSVKASETATVQGVFHGDQTKTNSAYHWWITTTDGTKLAVNTGLTTDNHSDLLYHRGERVTAATYDGSVISVTFSDGWVYRDGTLSTHHLVGTIMQLTWVICLFAFLMWRLARRPTRPVRVWQVVAFMASAYAVVLVSWGGEFRIVLLVMGIAAALGFAIGIPLLRLRERRARRLRAEQATHPSHP